MWLTNNLQWAPSSGQLSASSPPLPTKLLSHDPRERGCSVQLEAVEPDPLANTGNHSLLILIPNQGLHLNSQDDPQISRSSHYYTALPSCGCQIHHLFVLLPTDTKRLCWLRNHPGWIKVKETQDLATRTVLGTLRLISEGFRSYNIQYDSIRDQSYQIP